MGMSYIRKTDLRKAERFRELKEYTGLTYEKLAERLGYSDFQYMYAFASGQRVVSKEAADRIYRVFGWRKDYMLCADDYKTDEDLRNAIIGETYVSAWNALLHEIADGGDYSLSFNQAAPSYELQCVFTDRKGDISTLNFDDFKDKMLSYAQRLIKKAKE